MNRTDERIEQALTAEDLALLSQHAEPGYVSQAFGLFRGPSAWMMWVVNLANVAAFGFGLYALWRMFEAQDPLVALKWGVGAILLFQVTILSKTFMGQRLESNRVLREVKRLQVQVALLQPGERA